MRLEAALVGACDGDLTVGQILQALGLRMEVEVLRSLPGLHVGFILANADGLGVFQFGAKDSLPVVGDWDGDGTDTVGVLASLEFECRLDSRDPELWLECFNPTFYSNLTTGQHTLEVRALDGGDGGNMDPTPARYTWTVFPLPDPPAFDTVFTAGTDETVTAAATKLPGALVVRLQTSLLS